MQSSLHKLVEDVFDEQELALILNSAFLHISNIDNATDIQKHMSSFNGGWGNPLSILEKVRENLRASLTLATNSSSFSFVPMRSNASAVGDGDFHNAVCLNEIHRSKKESGT